MTAFWTRAWHDPIGAANRLIGTALGTANFITTLPEIEAISLRCTDDAPAHDCCLLGRLAEHGVSASRRAPMPTKSSDARDVNQFYASFVSATVSAESARRPSRPRPCERAIPRRSGRCCAVGVECGEEGTICGQAQKIVMLFPSRYLAHQLMHSL
jgi:hypothetical protein